MSVASKNLFAVLDEDASKASPVQEVKKTASTKKSDSAPANRNSRGPSKKPVSANEAAFRDRDIGRSANRNKTLEPKSENTRRPRTAGGKFDRHSRTGKVDSEKKIEKGWGDNKKELDDEVAGEAIAKADEAAAAAEDASAPVEEGPKTITLDEYFNQLNVQQKDVAADITVRKANDGKDVSGSVLKREEADFVSASKVKKEKSKKPKEKLTLEVEPVFANPERRERSERSERRGGDRSERRGGNRGGKPAGRRGPKSAGPARGGAQQKTKTVDLSSKDDFPALGA